MNTISLSKPSSHTYTWHWMLYKLKSYSSMEYLLIYFSSTHYSHHNNQDFIPNNENFLEWGNGKNTLLFRNHIGIFKFLKVFLVFYVSRWILEFSVSLQFRYMNPTWWRMDKIKPVFLLSFIITKGNEFKAKKEHRYKSILCFFK